MTDAAGDQELAAGPRRRSRRTAVTAVAALLLAVGAAAVAVGLIDQVADPVAAPHSTTQGDTAPSDIEPATEPATSQSAPEPATSQSAPAPSATPTADVSAAAAVGRPLELRIPAIEVQSELTTVGLDPDGRLEVPQPGPTYDNAAWYDGSPRPGEIGAAVIVGHVDSAATGPSIFYGLGALAVGDQVEVLRDDGTTATFVVDEVRGVPKNDFPTVEVYGRTDRPELRLITCGGDIGSDGHYVDNTVVFAHQI